jgi:riboflavin synthase
MFTGIVETKATVHGKTDTGLTLRRPGFFDDLAVGCSIAVAGVCLSVVTFDETTMAFNVVGETWARTNLGDRRPGEPVNVERSVRAGGRLEGHIVQGHVEGTAEVIELATDGPWTRLAIHIPEALRPFVVSKGAVALDGVSLTVATVRGQRCEVALIPHTLDVTTLGLLRPGDRVNVETDVIARYCQSLVAPYLPPSPS